MYQIKKQKIRKALWIDEDCPSEKCHGTNINKDRVDFDKIEQVTKIILNTFVKNKT